MKWKTSHIALVFVLASSVCFAIQPATRVDVASLKLEQLKSPFLLLNPAEIKQLKARISSEPIAKVSYANLIAQVEGYVAKPLLFPEEEGGPRNGFICRKCTSELSYNSESPNRHFCPKCEESQEGVRLNWAWRTTTFFELSKRMEEIGAAALLSGDVRYAKALKEAWLDLAGKYPKYRLHEKGMEFSGHPIPTSGRATCQSIEEAYFISKLAYSWDALLGTKILSLQEEALIQKNFWAEANGYYQRIFSFPAFGGNWGVWNCAGGMAVGVFTKDRQLIDNAYNHPKVGAMAFLEANYIRPDGLVDERSSTYQTFAMEGFSRMAHLSQRLGMNFHEDPRIRAAFTAYLQFLWPDYSVPCMNDSIRYRFSVADGSEKFGWDRPFNLLDLGWSMTQSQEIFQMLQILQGVPAVSKSREKRLYSLLYGPAEIKPVGYALPSVYLPESGIAQLRSPERDWSILLKNNPKPQGHAHPNALQIAMFANGEEFLPAFGAGNYALHFYGNWYTRTLGSNSISFNMFSQLLNGVENQMLWGITRGPVQAAFGASRKLQSPAGPGTAARINRLVLVTPMTMLEILRVGIDEEAKNKKTPLPINQLDAVLHFNGTLAWNPAAKEEASPINLPPLEELKTAFREQLKKDPKRKGVFRDPHADYGLLDNSKSLTPAEGGFITGELHQPKGGKVALALFPMGTEGNAWQFTGPGFEYDPNTPLPLVMRRLAANEARFGTVAIPFRESNPLRAVKLLVDTPVTTVLRVASTKGVETIFHHSQNGVLAAEAGKASLDGILGVITEPKGGHRLYTLLGKSLQDPAGKLTADAAVPVQMRLEGANPEFTNLGDQAVTLTWTPAKGEPVVKTFP